MDRQGRWQNIYIFYYPDVNGFVALQQFTIAGNWSTKPQRELGCCSVPESWKGEFNAALLLTGSPSRFTAQSKYWSQYFLHTMTRRTEEICSTDHLPPHTWLSHMHNELIIQSCIFTTPSLQPTCTPTCCQNRHPPHHHCQSRSGMFLLPLTQSHSDPSTLRLCLPLTIISSSGKEHCRFASQPSL